MQYCNNTPMPKSSSDWMPNSPTMAYVIAQQPQSPTYDIETALTKGTIFKELDKPFLGKGGCR